MQIAYKVSATKPVHKPAALNTIKRSQPEILKLHCPDLCEIYERANFINEECPVAPEYARELVY